MNIGSAHTAAKPVVFVMPTFLAVGGVERNTVEVMAKLRDDYDFVVVTFERLHSGQGSLHDQFLEHSLAIYDLGEIGDQEEIATYLRMLRSRYEPDLLWICNGCPWLAKHTGLVRNIFKDSAIVDQQAYDTEHGWISLYRQRDKGLLSFDRYIAINSKIQNVFEHVAGLAASRIDLIYSVISIEKRAQALAASKDDLRIKFGLENGKRYLASIGRLTSQKAPLDFVEVIDHLVQSGPPDIDFLIVGSGELGEAVDQAIREKQLGRRVRRLDYVQNTFELSRVIDGIVFTSLYEGLPIALLEALSLGTPGLCTDVGDISLVFEQYGNGMIFDAIGNRESLHRGAERFIAEYARFKDSAERNANAIATRFSMDAIGEQYRSCFKTAILSRSDRLLENIF